MPKPLRCRSWGFQTCHWKLVTSSILLHKGLQNFVQPRRVPLTKRKSHITSVPVCARSFAGYCLIFRSPIIEVLNHSVGLPLSLPLFDVLPLVPHVLAAAKSNLELHLVPVAPISFQRHDRHPGHSVRLLQQPSRLLLVQQQLARAALVVLEERPGRRVFPDVDVHQSAGSSVFVRFYEPISYVHLSVAYALFTK
ncbi:hypothetical protein ACHAWF_007098 [Thalassiosira exigua]